MEVPTTVSTKRQSKKAYVEAAPELNPAIGNNSKFSADLWAVPSNNYHRPIANMKPDSLEEIIKAAKKFTSHKGSLFGIVCGHLQRFFFF